MARSVQIVEPVATYRLQLTPEFGFDAAIDVLDHIRRLGVSHLYLSPISQAVPDSAHGYDVVDHTAVRVEFGGASGFERLLEAVATRRMAVIFDHVPNHVAATRPDLNPTWWALLRDGPGTEADDWFDVDWELTRGRVILPVLGASRQQAIEEGAIAVDRDELVVYGERRLPLAPGTEGLPLVELLAAQHYVLQHWRNPARNVRRFFTIDDLVAVRVEHEHVAEVVDTLPARYADHEGFGGVRVDHVDGLADPAGYLTGLRRRIGDEALLYVEKIVAPGEWLPASWPVDGTTGYEFIRSVDHVLLAAGAESAFDALWADVGSDGRTSHELEIAGRQEVVDEALAPGFGRLLRIAARALAASEADLRDEVERLTTRLPRYRTYLPGDPDAERLIGAISKGPVAGALLDPQGAEQIEMRRRWQQLTGPVMAKGAEDRSFYRYLRLASLCEVGGDPGRFGITVDDFHADNERRLAAWPLAMLAASTHDTKRSEDVRARSTALTWLTAAEPDRTIGFLRGWVVELAGRTGVDQATASLAAQTVLTTPHLDATRLGDYLVKACREAATHTEWEHPNDDFERRLVELAELATSVDPESQLGLDTIAPGISLAATALRLTSPGVPDLYQGSEAFVFQLVDPDNRVSPDWEALERFAVDDRTVAALWAENDPADKTVLVRELLALRRRRPGAFGARGAYTPIEVSQGAIAYGRGDDVVVAVRRGAAEVTGPLTFPAGTWYDVLDPEAPTLSGTVEAAAVVGSGAEQTLPVAVFERD